MQSPPRASVLIPTRARPHYLDVTLRSIAPQAKHEGAEVLVISDGLDEESREVAQHHGARMLELSAPSGLNAVRNEGIKAASGDLLVFVDDDVIAPPGWLEAYLSAANARPVQEVFGGPIWAQLEGGGPRACGREKPPITTLDLGTEDRDVQLVWGANMAVRSQAFMRLGGFDETITGAGDEEDWLRRYLKEGNRVRYLANAGLVHRRSASDAKLIKLAGAAYRRGKTARRYDERKHTAPPIRGELLTLAGCAWHTFRRRCALGLVFAAHTAGRLHQALAGRQS